ncbi:uncharacterized protein LOC132280220 isoform X2 [Cornus florida]|uniref:uncharacterized protein LOC132280220 isoform X2 n=1 Tax=Cornus florida TaxID=4283 RepID=UPI00289F1230|nr:uncharacterized protein LOC132280220 isoform X2 [Cornus florida]
MPPTPTKKGKEKPTPFPSLSPKNLQQKLYTHFLSHPKALDATMALSYSLSHRKTLDATMALSYSLSHRKTLDATMALRALNTIYSKLLSRMAVCSLRTFAPINSNSESDIPTNNSDSDLRSKQLPHAEGKKNRAFNRFMKDGSTFPRKVLNDDEKYARMDMPVTRKQGLKLLVADNSLNALEEVDDDPLSVEEYRMSYFGNIDLPQSLYKMGNIVTELKDIAFSLKPQMMMRNTCDSRRWFTSRTDSVSDAANVESNAFSTNAAGNAFSTNVSGNAIHGEGPGILHRMVRAIYIKEGNFPNIDNFIASSVSFINEGNFKSIHNCIPNLVVFCGPQQLFFEEKHNIILENYGLFKKGNTDWHVAGVSKTRYISINDFMSLILWIPRKYEKRIYNYLFNQQIYVLESSPMTLLKYSGLCSWKAPFDGQYKLNVSVFFKKNLGGTKEAFCGEVLRDCRGRILEIFYKPFPDATSRDEVFLLGVLHGIDEILKRRSEAKYILLEINHKKIVKVLNREKDRPIECLGLYQKHGS